MKLTKIYFSGITRECAIRLVKISLFVFAMLVTTALRAEPCTSPGEPEGCIEIDTPLDTHIWLLMAAVLTMTAYIMLKKSEIPSSNPLKVDDGKSYRAV